MDPSLKSHGLGYEPLGGRWDWISIANIPSSSRDARSLVTALGYDSLNDLLDTIPRGGVILDVGCGRSNFFRTVAVARPDVTAVNYDIKTVKELFGPDHHDLPHNLRYDSGDMRTLPYDAESFDWIFSYWALSYLVDGERRDVLMDFYRLTRPNGRISIGPYYDQSSNAFPPEIAQSFVKGVDVDTNNVEEWASGDPAIRIRSLDSLYIEPLRNQ
jgi:SAM-dependent methyltransferase